MPKNTYYLNSSTVAPYLDFRLEYGDLSLAGTSIFLVGSRRAESIYLMPGISFDFTAAGAGEDTVYLQGNLADYSISTTVETITFTRGSGINQEIIRMSAMAGSSADMVVFHDGSALASVIANAANNFQTPTLNLAQTSATPITHAVGLTSVAAYADSGPSTFTSFNCIALMVVGSRGVDKVYVKEGSSVDATALGGGLDLVYMRGNWADYAKSCTGETMTFIRSTPSGVEKIIASAMSGGGNDQLIFFDGGIKSNDARLAFGANFAITLSAITGYNKSLITPGVDTSIINPSIGPSGSNQIHVDLIITNTKTFTISGLEINNNAAYVSGVDHIDFQLDGSANWTTLKLDTPVSTYNLALSNPLNDGLHSIYLRQVDLAGNTSAIVSQSFSLDTTAVAPALALSTDSGFSNSDGITNSKTFTVSSLELASAINGMSGFHHVEWQLDGTAGIWIAESIDSTNFNLGAISDGSHALYVRQIDHVGNTSNAAKQQFIFDSNVAMPTAIINGINETSNPNHLGRSFSFTFDGMEQIDITHGASGFHHFEYSLDNSQSWVSAGIGKTGLMLTEPMADGLHNISFRQVDTAGNYSQATSATFVLDTSVATPSLNFSSDGASGASFSAMGLEVQDRLHSGFKNLVYQVDGSTWITELDGITSFTIKNLTTGSHTINLYEVDWLGNASATVTLNFSHNPYWSASSGWGEANVLGAMNIIGQTSYTSSVAPTNTPTQLKSMDFQSAWNLGYTGKGIVIADIDTGIDLTNDTFMKSINRYMDGAWDWNFINSTADVQDDNNHGTFTAMEAVSKKMPHTIGGKTYYTQGGAYDAQLMTLKALDGSGKGSNYNLASAIYWAVDHEADVINLSLGSELPNPGLYSAVQYASDHNVITCIAAGNSSGTSPMYPAHYADSFACAIAVGASQTSIDGGHTLWYGSNQAGSSVPYNFVTAPGADIFGIGTNGRIGFMSGTSMAAPLIAAEVAVLMSMQLNATAQQIVEAVMLSASPLSVI